MEVIDKKLLDDLSAQAKASPRLRKNYNFHQSLDDLCHRMLNALELDTEIPIHHHPDKDETIVILRGKIRVTTYNDNGTVAESVVLNQEDGCYGVNIPKNVWHTMEALESNSCIFESKQGPFVPHEEEGILIFEKKNIMNTSDLDEIVKDYLKAPKTDYAIMINGGWGSGKSYYLTHEFKTLVENTLVPDDEVYEKKKSWRNKEPDIQKNYSPAFISLYGVSSVEDFEVRVFSGINSWTNNAFFRVAGLVGSKIADFFGVTSDKKDAKAVTFIRKNRVLVFDDLERISENKMSVKEVLGLINSYAEHSNLKVIIVCNEKEYLSEDADGKLHKDYKKYKEKSVRFTYKYVPGVSVVYDTMVSNVSDANYKAYLVDEKPSILSLFDLGGDKNLRTLKFFIDTFGKIYNLVKSAKHQDKVIRTYLVTFMLYVCEHKRGHQADDLESLSEKRFSLILNGFLGAQPNDEKQVDNKKDFIGEFQEAYNSVYSEFRPNNTFVEYIITGSLNVDELKSDIQNLDSEFDRMVIKPEGKVYQKLLCMTELNDGEATQLIEEMMSYLKEDKYNLYDLLQIYSLLLKFDFWNVEGFKLTDALDGEFLASMQRQELKHQYNAMFDIKTPIFDNDGKNKRQFDKYKDIKDAAMGINLQAKKRMDEVSGNKFIMVAESGDVGKIRACRMDEKKRIAISGLNLKKIAKMIKEASNPVACELCECIIAFIPGKGFLQPYEVEMVKGDLLPVLEECLTSGNNRIRNIYITELRNYLKEITS